EAAPTSSRPGSKGIASALSTTAVPSGSERTGGSRSRPKASWTTSRRITSAPSTSAVPSPPSAMGSGSASTPARANPATSAAAASEALRTPLRLAGDASARTSLAVLRGSCQLLLGARHLRLGRVGHAPQHREREPLAREEDQADPDADRGLDRLEPEPVGDRG